MPRVGIIIPVSAVLGLAGEKSGFLGVLVINLEILCISFRPLALVSSQGIDRTRLLWPALDRCILACGVFFAQVVPRLEWWCEVYNRFCRINACPNFAMPILS